MTSNQSHRTLIAGSISIDKIINKYGTYDNVLGGSAAYALLATPKKGCQLVGVVGSDFPDQYLNLLDNHSITLDDLMIPDGKTFTWGGEYAPDFSSRETLYVNPGIAERCLPVLSGKSKQCEYLLLGNTSPKVQLAILDQIETKPFIILDTFKLYIDTTLEDLKKTMHRSDLLCINYNEALYLSKLSNPSIDDIAKCILDMGVKSLIIKKGEEGASFFNNQDNFSIAAYYVDQVMDTTGAGDSFVGGLISSLMNGADIKEAMVEGSVMASFCIENIAHKGLISFPEEEYTLRKKWLQSSLTT
ncbi:MAG: PfkB family carbohydrate kinase [Candidatus Neomarinimicrobiota bacterium]|nr:PfkB family carbohydrate kinase [Candidatus Neomarinimicrobiota bacterium]